MNDTVHIDRSFEFTVPMSSLNQIGMIEIYVVRCDLVRELVETETDPKIAAHKFTDRLTEALLPASSIKKHIRMLQMVIKDHDGDIIARTNTGPFACAHLTTGKEPGIDEGNEE